MIIAKSHYQDNSGCSILVKALHDLLNNLETEPLFVCIGSDHHLLDCFGPLTGSMLADSVPELTVLGTLDRPLHAQNLIRELKEIKKLYIGKTEIAIDASVGNADEIGLIQLHKGSLLPGKAFAKNLPPVGEFSITGVVDVRLSPQAVRTDKRPGLGHVYYMASLLSTAICDWYRSK
ncbi:MAG: spore protease YyaC [Syntrophomonas sp.]|nr:spore protease YyaC [Syntrophomonas sp.]